MPIMWEKSSGDIRVNINNSRDVVVIFGSAHGGWDYPGIIENSTTVDVYGIRDTKVSWFQDPGASFTGLHHIEDYLHGVFQGYRKKVLCGLSMGGSAALYFGSRYADASIIAASPQFFQYQFLWNANARTNYEMIEKMPDRLNRRRATDIEIFTCTEDGGEVWNWRDSHAASLAQELFKLPVTRIEGRTHASWEHFSMSQKISERIGRSLFDPQDEGSGRDADSLL